MLKVSPTTRGAVQVLSPSLRWGSVLLTFSLVALHSRCGEGEELVRNCTPSSNTECKKVHLKSDSTSGTPSHDPTQATATRERGGVNRSSRFGVSFLLSVGVGVIVSLALVAVAVFVGIAVCWWKNRSNRGE